MNTTFVYGAVIIVILGVGAYVLYTNMHTQSEMTVMIDHSAHRDMGEMEHSMDMSVTSEQDFLRKMIPHHQEAVDTANQVLERGGTTPAILQLAETIIVTQTIEIETMKSWYESWYNEPYVVTGEYMPMMRELTALSGVNLDRTFLEDMIPHHEGAIMMAQNVEPYIEHPEVAELTQTIVTSQAEEITLMRQLLQSL